MFYTRCHYVRALYLYISVYFSLYLEIQLLPACVSIKLSIVLIIALFLIPVPVIAIIPAIIKNIPVVARSLVDRSMAQYAESQ